MKSFARWFFIAAVWLLARALALAEDRTHCNTKINFEVFQSVGGTNQVFFTR